MPGCQRSLTNDQDPVAFLPPSEPSGLENPKSKGSALQNRSTVFVSVFCYCVGLCLSVCLFVCYFVVNVAEFGSGLACIVTHNPEVRF